jgi:hypothetical protein
MLRPDYSGWDSDAKPLYGLCTEDGKIVVDPVYNNVERLESGGHTVYVLQTFHPLEYDLWGVRSETTFAGPNGTWAVTYPACAYHPGGHFYSESVWEAFPVHDGNGWGAVDYAGRLVYPCVEENPVLFGGGLATVLDSETGLYGYKDPQGAWVIEPSYADASAFYGDYAVIVTQQSDVAVIDRGGGFIASFTEWGYVVPLDARRFVVYENAGRLMDASGAVLAEGFGAWLNNGWLSTRLGDSLTRLEKDGVSFELPHTVDYGYPGDRFRVSGPFDENDEESWLWWGLADTNGQILLERPKGQDLNIQPLASGRTLSVRHDKGRGLYGLLDTDLTELIPHKYQFIAEFGEYYAVKEGLYGGLVDQNGTWIVKTVLPGE